MHWHPKYIEGAGIEDFEECERTFSGSNNLASCTRLARPFHRLQKIEQHFVFHNLDKYGESATFIYQNYRQALSILRDEAEELAMVSSELGTGPDDYEAYLLQEREYLRKLKTEPEDVLETVNYMEALQHLNEAKAASDLAKREYDLLDHYIINGGIKRNEIKNI